MAPTKPVDIEVALSHINIYHGVTITPAKILTQLATTGYALVEIIEDLVQLDNYQIIEETCKSLHGLIELTIASSKGSGFPKLGGEGNRSLFTLADELFKSVTDLVVPRTSPVAATEKDAALNTDLLVDLPSLTDFRTISDNVGNLSVGLKLFGKQLQSLESLENLTMVFRERTSDLTLAAHDGEIRRVARLERRLEREVTQMVECTKNLW